MFRLYFSETRRFASSNRTEGILEALVGLGVINPPHRRVASGFVMIDICRMNRDKIAEYSGMVLAKLPAEVSASVGHGGIYLSGGMAKLMGLDDYLSEKLQMDVYVSDEPQMAVILGGGAAIGNEDILETIRVDY